MTNGMLINSTCQKTSAEKRKINVYERVNTAKTLKELTACWSNGSFLALLS
jgi:hypothetical protein